MKKLVFLLVLAMSLCANAVTNVVGDSVKAGYPGDVDTVMLHDNTAASVDTFSAGEAQTYGPYRLTAQSGQPMYKGFQLYARAITGTTPTMQVSYQLLPFNSASDTTGLWTAFDSLDDVGADVYVDLSSKAGRAIMFKILNYDGTACQIPAQAVISFKKAIVYNDK